MINTIEFSRRLETSGFKREQAEGIMTVNLELIELHLPSKLDVTLIHARLDRLEARVEQLGVKFEKLDSKFEDKIEKLEQKMERRFSELNKILIWAFGLIFSTQMAIILKLFF